jgi:hypothetical protein
MDLFEQLKNQAPREEAGANTLDRFGYQHSWAILRLIAEHSANRPYAFGFELHDDVVHLDGETSPSLIIFTQVKTREKNAWKLSELLTDDGGKSRSILHKLLALKAKFPTLSSKFILASNMHFEFLQGVGEKTCNKLTVAQRNQIVDSLAARKLSITQAELADLTFHVSDLALLSHETTLKGYVQEFLKSTTGSEVSVQHVSAFLQSLRDEIRIKSISKLSRIKTVQDLISKKCLTKSQIDAYLRGIQTKIDSALEWTTIQPFLMKDGIDNRLIVRIGRQWNRFWLQSLNPTDFQLTGLVKEIVTALAAMSDVERASAKTVLSEVRPRLSPTPQYTEDFVLAAILHTHYGQQ